MALVESNMLPLGTIAPDFSLPNVVDNSLGSLSNLKGEKGTFRSIYRGSANEGLRGQGMAALILFVALGLLQGKHPSIAKQIKRVNKAYEIDPLFGQHFYKLRDIRNTDKRRDPNFENFREGFYRALKTFGTKLR